MGLNLLLCTEHSVLVCTFFVDPLKAEKESVVLVRNTTSGINSIMNSLRAEIKGIVVFSHVYAAMMNTSKVHREKYNADVFVVDVNLPITSEKQIIDDFRKVVESNKQINFALLGKFCSDFFLLQFLDHISSASAIVFPVEKLIAICKDRMFTD